MSRVNPLVTLRESAGMGVGEIASKAGVTPSAVVRAEQAVYTSPPPKLLDALWRYAPEDDLHDYGILLADYHHFQKEVRQKNFGTLDYPYAFMNTAFRHTAFRHRGRNQQMPTHPFVEWRIDSGVNARIQISKSFCVHPALIFKFESQPHLCVSPPGELVKALIESGYPDKLMLQLSEAYTLYRDSLKAHTVLT